ncbi:MAG: tyrosine-type recombinase/integrase [Lachnospiraceae bacterium]|nr:tyrosine-type recombinase/integrase [Lachnospiraceae bacterium]
MSKQANIGYQFTSAINDCFKPGMDKHSIKASEGSDYRIYSYAAREDMISFSKQFSHFMKYNFPEVRQVKNITVEHINSFLSLRTNVTEKTVRHDISCFNKLELVCSKKFGLRNLDWRTNRIVPKVEKERIRDAVFSDKQISLLKDYFETRGDSYGKRAFYIAERTSCRVSEIAKLQARDIKENQDGTGVLSIVDSKGKRSRDIELTKDDVKLFKDIIGDKSGSERLVPLRENSINQYLHRACKHLGFTNILNAKTGYHSLRKATIRHYYHNQIPLVGEKRARELSMLRLGHSANRTDLCHIYLGI